MSKDGVPSRLAERQSELGQGFLGMEGGLALEFTQSGRAGAQRAGGIGDEKRKAVGRRSTLDVRCAQAQREVEQHLAQTGNYGRSRYGGVTEWIGAVKYAVAADDVGELLREQVACRVEFGFQQEHGGEAYGGFAGGVG